MSSSHTVQTTGGGVSPVTTAETVVATITIPPENQGSNADGIYLTGTVAGTTGAGTTQVAIRVRIGTLTGAQVGYTFTSNATASALWSGGFDCLDGVTSYPAGNTYVITVQQTGATGNGTLFNAAVTASPSTPLVG